MMNKHRFLLVLTICLLCILPLCASATGMEVVPLDETEGYHKEYYITDVDLALLLPIFAQVETYYDAVSKKTFFITLPEYTDSLFIFFAFKNDDLINQSLSDINPYKLQGVLSMISRQAASLDYTMDDALVPGERFIRMPEPIDEYYTEHLIALRNGWVLNVMLVQYYNDTTPLEDLTAVQDALMASIYTQGGIFDHVQSIALPDSDIVVTVPDTLQLCLATEEPSFYEILVSPRAPGNRLSAVHVFAVRDESFKNQTVLTLEQAALDQAMLLPTAEKAYAADSVVITENYASGQPVVYYESDNSEGLYMLGLRDGWALYASVMPVVETLNPAWLQSLQAQLMHQLMGDGTTVQDWIPGLTTVQDADVLRLPLLNGMLSIAIPSGYGVDIWQDNAVARDIYLYALDGTHRYYNISTTPSGLMTGDGTIADLFVGENMQAACNRASQVASDMGYAAKSEYDPAGFGNIPAIHTTTKEKNYEHYYGLIDSCLVSLSFTSEDSPMTEAEAESLRNLIQ